jgi:hypothetical protein
VDSWDVLDLLDTVTPVKDTVLKPQSIRSALKSGARRRYAVRASQRRRRLAAVGGGRSARGCAEA